MVWIEFVFSAAVIVYAANKLAAYGDHISLRTGLGGMFVGTLLLSGATSLPELLTGINSINQDVPDLTVGNLFGSCMFNMFMLAILDFANQNKRILRLVAINHSLTAGLAIFLIGTAVFFIQAKIDLTLFNYVGADSLILILAYIAGTNLIHTTNSRDASPVPEFSDEELAEQGIPSLRFALAGFAVATLALILITPLMVSSSIGIARSTGLSTGFVGIALVAVVTSLPEAATTLSAVRMEAYDLAVGNLFGSNIFNIFALGLTDFFYVKGAFLYDIQPTMGLAGMIGLLLTALALVGNLARSERRFFFVEVDALLIMLGYLAGMWFLYSRGIVG